jgi:hypothetical protein
MEGAFETFFEKKIDNQRIRAFKSRSVPNLEIVELIEE